MSRRTNKIATQAETADLVSALSEAAGSSSSSAPIHAMRGASAALLAKEIIPNPQPVASSSAGLGFRSFFPVASICGVSRRNMQKMCTFTTSSMPLRR